MTVSADIIVPVWNRPVETRECLVSLMEHSPSARIVMVDNGSDRDTEALLEEFAEILGERALLLRTEVNLGFIRGVNRGLERVEAPWCIVVRSGTVVTPGWLDAIFDAGRSDPAAGIVVPRVIPMEERGQRISSAPPYRETAPATFDVIALRTELVSACGRFDDSMDGGEWALRDYVRRAWRHGFISLLATPAIVYGSDDIVLGSEVRRADTRRRSMAAYRERWGEERSFLVFFPPGSRVESIEALMDPLREGARQGGRFTLLLDHRACRSARKGWLGSLHEAVRLESLPLLFARGALRKRVEAWRAEFPQGTVIAGGDCEGIASEPPDRLLEEVALRRREKYSKSGVA